jgi:hypothetical protein
VGVVDIRIFDAIPQFGDFRNISVKRSSQQGIVYQILQIYIGCMSIRKLPIKIVIYYSNFGLLASFECLIAKILNFRLVVLNLLVLLCRGLYTVYQYTLCIMTSQDLMPARNAVLVVITWENFNGGHFELFLV